MSENGAFYSLENAATPPLPPTATLPSCACSTGLMKAFLRIEPKCITKVVLGYRSSPQLLNTVLQIKAAKNAPWQVTRAILSLDSHAFDEELIEA